MNKCQRTSLVLCRDNDCEAMYGNLPESFKTDGEDTILPCGHKIGRIIFAASVLKEAFREAERASQIGECACCGVYGKRDQNGVCPDCAEEMTDVEA